MTYESLTQHYKTATNEYRAAYYWLRNHAEHEPKRTPHDKRAKLWHVDDIAAYKAQHEPNQKYNVWQQILMRYLQKPMTVNQLLDHLAEHGIFFAETTSKRNMIYWLERGFLTRTGKGTKGSPYVYSIAVEVKDAA